MNTLLEKAKAYKRPSSKQRDMTITDEHIELAIAWTKDEITYTQMLGALFGNAKGSMQAYVIVARSLREAMRRGIIEETPYEGPVAT